VTAGRAPKRAFQRIQFFKIGKRGTVDWCLSLLFERRD